MKHVVSLILCAILLVTCFALCAHAAEETTEESQSQQQPLHIIFNGEVIGKKSIIHSTNGMNKGAGISKSGEWEGIKIDIRYTEDPHIGLNYDNFISKMGFEPQNIEDSPFIVLKLKADEIAFDDFEIYYCAGDVTEPVEACRTASDYAHDAGNGVYYFVYDLTDDAKGAMHFFRVDIDGAEEGAVAYLTEMAFFATEDEALEWCDSNSAADGTDAETTAPEGNDDQTAQQPETNPTTTEESTSQATTQPTTEAATTEALTAETQTTQAPQTTAPAQDNGGCGSMISTGALVVILVSLGMICTKKKN